MFVFKSKINYVNESIDKYVYVTATPRVQPEYKSNSPYLSNVQKIKTAFVWP